MYDPGVRQSRNVRDVLGIGSWNAGGQGLRFARCRDRSASHCDDREPKDGAKTSKDCGR